MDMSRALDRIQVASPCSARWADMVGDEKSRFCSQCQLRVYNLSAMETAEAEELIARHNNRLCVRFYRRRDGTVMTQDCPVGDRDSVLAARWRRAMATAAVFAVGTSVLAWVSTRTSTTMGDITSVARMDHAMGRIQQVIPPTPTAEPQRGAAPGHQVEMGAMATPTFDKGSGRDW